MLLYKSKDLLNWEFDRVLISSNDLGYMLECPSTARIKDKRVLITSPQGLNVRGEDFWNVYSSIYAVGSLDLKKLDYMDVKEIDHGLDFYAPHILSNGDILISWMSIWERSLPLQELNNEWINTFTLPRKLSLKRGKLIQTPVDSITKKFKEDYSYEGYVKDDINLKGKFKHLHLEFNKGGDVSIKVFKKGNKYAELRYDDGKLIIDRNNSLNIIKSVKEEKSSDNYRVLTLPNKKVTLDIYLDRILMEVYINNGEEVMSMVCVHPQAYNQISISSKKGKKIKLISKKFRK